MADEQLYPEHRKTYSGFIKLIAYSLAAVIITLLLMAAFLL